MVSGVPFETPASFVLARETVALPIFSRSATCLVDLVGASLRIISRSRCRSALERCRRSTLSRSQFLALGVTEVAHDPEGILGQPEFLDGFPALMSVDENVIGGNQDGLEDASLPDRVPELGVFLGR